MINELQIKRRTGIPVGDQIASFLKSKIRQKKLVKGEKLPTTNEIAETLGVGTHTVRSAMLSLEKEGLVRSVPKLGTIVNELSSVQDSKMVASVRSKELVLAVTGLIGSERTNNRFRPETAEGVIRVCNSLNIDTVILPRLDSFGKPDLLYQKMKKHNCQGLMDVEGDCDQAMFDYLSHRGIQVVVPRRYKSRDKISCIESDYDGAGYESGMYFIANGCDRVAMFSHYQLNCTENDLRRFGYPTGIKQGLHRAFEGKDASADIDFYPHILEDRESIADILTKLKSISSKTGIVFTNGYHFLELLKIYPAEARQLLRDKKIVVISNKTINLQLEMYAGDIDFMVVLDVYEEIARKMVSMLVGLIEGYLPKNSTLMADIKLLPFHEILNGYKSF